MKKRLVAVLTAVVLLLGLVPGPVAVAAGDGTFHDITDPAVAEAAELVANYGIVPKAPVAEKALPACNIVYIAGEEMKADLQGYLQVLYDQNPDSVGGALPGDDFYYGA